MKSSPLTKFHADFHSKKILIFGLGLLGRGAGDARFFVSLGCPVRVTDLKSKAQLQASLAALDGLDLEYVLGKHRSQDIDWADVIIRNAAVPWDHPLLIRARELGKPVYMDTQLFVRYANIPIIGITGTRGKTTTSHMTHTLLSTLSDKKILLGGNISGRATLPLLADITQATATLAVLELSSWQLQAFKTAKISPHIAAVTNLYPDHLNTYKNMSEYIKDKQTITRFQTGRDHLIVNTRQKARVTAFLQTKAQVHWFDAADLPAGIALDIPGNHNRENAAAAIKIATLLGIKPAQSLPIIQHFPGVPFRLQHIATVNNIKIFNDTTSTTPTATAVALESFNRPVILILGGSDKKLPVSHLAKKINHYAKKVLLIPGDGTQRIEKLLLPQLVIAKSASVTKLVKIALAGAKPGDIILFSPGFTSFGTFSNEFDRGVQFNQAVAAL
jgi:UDP-N-acetylmuramoylalanine--D-glutamate ligase